MEIGRVTVQKGECQNIVNLRRTIMKNTNWTVLGVASWMVVSSVCTAWSQDWPQWRGPNRDGKVNGFTTPGEWPPELTPKWKVTVGSGDATPALVNERLYVFARQGEDEVTLCLNAANGKELWRDQYAAQAVTGAAGSRGCRSAGWGSRRCRSGDAFPDLSRLESPARRRARCR